MRTRSTITAALALAAATILAVAACGSVGLRVGAAQSGRSDGRASRADRPHRCRAMLPSELSELNSTLDGSADRPDPADGPDDPDRLPDGSHLAHRLHRPDRSQRSDAT